MRLRTSFPLKIEDAWCSAVLCWVQSFRASGLVDGVLAEVLIRFVGAVAVCCKDSELVRLFPVFRDVRILLIDLVGFSHPSAGDMVLVWLSVGSSRSYHLGPIWIFTSAFLIV